MTEKSTSSASLLAEALQLQSRALSAMQQLASQRQEAQSALAIQPLEPAGKVRANGLAAAAGHLLRIRALRAQAFDTEDLFADPAWDMLLTLYVEEARGRDVQVSSLCIASLVPATTALRWIRVLEKGGWIEKQPSETDRRVNHVTLSERSRDAIEAVLSRAVTLF